MKLQLASDSPHSVFAALNRLFDRGNKATCNRCILKCVLRNVEIFIILLYIYYLPNSNKMLRIRIFEKKNYKTVKILPGNVRSPQAQHCCTRQELRCTHKQKTRGNIDLEAQLKEQHIFVFSRDKEGLRTSVTKNGYRKLQLLRLHPQGDRKEGPCSTVWYCKQFNWNQHAQPVFAVARKKLHNCPFECDMKPLVSNKKK